MNESSINRKEFFCVSIFMPKYRRNDKMNFGRDENEEEKKISLNIHLTRFTHRFISILTDLSK